MIKSVCGRRENGEEYKDISVFVSPKKSAKLRREESFRNGKKDCLKYRVVKKIFRATNIMFFG